MENILDSIEEENIANLFRLKNRVYNKTFKNYICIFKQIKNINFYINIKYENIDFSTVIIDKNINNHSFQDNISLVLGTLAFLNDELNEKITQLSQIVENCKDYSKLKKEDKELIKDSYFFARCIQILCTTDYYKYYLENSFDIYVSVENELQSSFWLSFKIYIRKILKLGQINV
ncbi:hypothetical protein NG767_09940 [Aliarcobacter cryaerophilus]|uniref:hypothetical protein n=1 Tax=Aliarcobacter cryaerophilus TaxID=28198 RepID=UPI003DA60995